MLTASEQLVGAVRRGDFAAVRRLVEEEGADPKAAEDDLAACVENGGLDLVEFLVGHGVKVGSGALSAAMKADKIDIFRYLIWKGADATSANNGTSVFFGAVGDGKLAAVECIVETGADIDAPGVQGSTRTALLEAMSCGNVEVAKYLIANGANLEARDENDDTALIAAAQGGELGMVEVLVEHGADVNAAGFNDGTALLQAITNGHFEVAAVLAKQGADVNARNKIRSTPLVEAVMRGNVDIVEALIDQGADVHAATMLGWTPLIQAAVCGHLKITELLIDRGAVADTRDAFGRNALEWAKDEKRGDVAAFLSQRT